MNNTIAEFWDALEAGHPEKAQTEWNRVRQILDARKFSPVLRDLLAAQDQQQEIVGLSQRRAPPETFEKLFWLTLTSYFSTARDGHQIDGRAIFATTARIARVTQNAAIPWSFAPVLAAAGCFLARDGEADEAAKLALFKPVPDFDRWQAGAGGEQGASDDLSPDETESETVRKYTRMRP